MGAAAAPIPAFTVTGLAESFLTADLAVWPLRITATGGDLAGVQEQIDRSFDRAGVLAEQEIGGDPGFELRAPEGLVGLGPSVGARYPDIAQHVIAELRKLAALAAAVDPPQADLRDPLASPAAPPEPEPPERKE